MAMKERFENFDEFVQACGFGDATPMSKDEKREFLNQNVHPIPYKKFKGPRYCDSFVVTVWRDLSQYATPICAVTLSESDSVKTVREKTYRTNGLDLPF